MVVYIMGVALFLSTQRYTDAMMLCVIIYWTNVAWFNEGMLKHSVGLLKEAQAIIEKHLKDKEPVSEREEA